MLSPNHPSVKNLFDFSTTFPDMAAFVDAAEREVKKMDRPNRAGRKNVIDVKAILASIWMIGRTGMQWRFLGLLKSVDHNIVFYHFQKWGRLGLWRRLALDLIERWRKRMGLEAGPSVAVVDSRSVRSTPTCGLRGIDGGKKVKGIKLHALVDKFGLPLEFVATAANVGDRDGLRLLLSTVYDEIPSVRSILGDLGYTGDEVRLDAALAGTELKTKRCGDKKTGFIPTEIRWVVERTFAWLAQWRRTSVVYERLIQHHVDFSWIAIASIVAARLSRGSRDGYVNTIC